jgi:hypothetical protein
MSDLHSPVLEAFLYDFQEEQVVGLSRSKRDIKLEVDRLLSLFQNFEICTWELLLATSGAPLPTKKANSFLEHSVASSKIRLAKIADRLDVIAKTTKLCGMLESLRKPSGALTVAYGASSTFYPKLPAQRSYELDWGDLSMGHGHFITPFSSLLSLSTDHHIQRYISTT